MKEEAALTLYLLLVEGFPSPALIRSLQVHQGGKPEDDGYCHPSESKINLF